MKEGLTYVILGCIWLLVVAITGARKTLTTYIYAAIGLCGTIYGIYLLIINASILVTIFITVIITVAICALIGLYMIRKRDEVKIDLTNDDEIPEMTPEERYLYNLYKEASDEDKKKEETPLR